MDRPSQMVVSNTLIDMAGYSGQPIAMTTTTAARTPSIRFEDTTILGSNVATKLIQFGNNASAGWERIEFHSSRVKHVGLRITGAQMLLMTSTTVELSPDNGVLVFDGAGNPFSSRTVQFQGCSLINNWDAGLFIAVSDATVNCFDTLAINNNVNSAKSSNKSSFVFSPGSGSDNAVLMVGNVVGDNQSSPTQINAVFYNSNVDTVIDANSVILGGLIAAGTPAAIVVVNRFDEASNSSTASGFQAFTNGVLRLTGPGSPEGVVSAPISSTFHRSDGGAGTSWYVKESGTGNTGWVGK